MLNLNYFYTKKNFRKEKLGDGERASVFYHDIFDYPLDFSELIKWRAGKKSLSAIKMVPEVSSKNGYFFIEGKEGLVYKRTLRKRISERKLQEALKIAKILGLIPGIKMIGVTGSLAMGNSVEEGDIDLMIVTKVGNLWTTRLFVYLVIHLLGIKRRKPKDSEQKDRLCLNIWLDENSLSWNKKDRNIYTAHEIAQIIPLVNKGMVYEKLISSNKWIYDYWPSAVVINSLPIKDDGLIKKTNIFEKIAFKLQYLYMRNKITRESVTPTHAFFHPEDWGKIILGRLSS